MLKKLAIMLFLSLSGFMVLTCFVRKINNKPPISMNYVLDEFSRAKIDYNITKDVEQLSNSLRSLSNNFSNSSNDLISAVKSIADMIYYIGRFIINLIIHTLVATLNIIIYVLRIMGFNVNYINLGGASSMLNIPDDVRPPHWN